MVISKYITGAKEVELDAVGKAGEWLGEVLWGSCGCKGLGFRVYGLRFTVYGLGFRV